MHSEAVLQKNRRRIGSVALYCKNNCGFYGNQAWNGYCSKCYKELHQKAAPASSTVRKVQDVGDNSSTLKFDKFEEKKKQKQDSKRESMKKFFKKSQTVMTSPQQQQQQHVRRNMYVESAREFKASSRDFVDFLKTLKKPATRYIDDHCKSFTFDMYENIQLPIDVKSQRVQDFYVKMEKIMQSNPSFKDMSPEELEKMMDGIEKFVMTHIYQICQPSLDDELKDKELKKRLASLNWVTSEQLEIPLDFDKEVVDKLFKQAQNELLEMNSRKAPQDKLACIVKCSLTIFRMLKSSTDVVASADDFLPVLIYVVLKTNPPFLHSEVQYITRFCNPNKLMAGEGGYYFTNLCGAVSFVKEMDAQSLNISEDEFNSYMKGEKPLRSVKLKQRKYTVTCDGLEEMQQNLEEISQLREKQAKTLELCRSIRKDMSEFRENFKKQIEIIVQNDGTGENFVHVQPYLDRMGKEETKLIEIEEF